jgi:hypothetical protein
MSLYDIYCSGIYLVLTGFAVNLATSFILYQHVSQNCNVLIKRPNFSLENISFQVCIQDVLVLDLTQEAGYID